HISSLLDSFSKNARNYKPQPSSDAEHRDDEGVSEIDNQEKSENSTQDVNTAGPSFYTASTNDNTEVYVDDNIFGSTKKELCTEFERLMKDKFQMSSMRELTFFLRLQVKQKEDGIFISQDKYVTESRVLALETTKANQALKIESLKRRVKKLEKKASKKAYKLKRLYKIDEHVISTFNDPLLSGEDRMKLSELMELCTQLQSRVLALETTKANQALKIGSLKRRVKKLEKKASKKAYKLKRLYKIGSSTRVKSSEDADMFDTSILDDEEVVSKKEVSTDDPITTAGEVVTTAGVEVSAAAITSQISIDEITLAKALIDIKTSQPKAKRIVMQETSESPTPTPIDSSQQSSKAKEKGKAKMIKPEKHLKRKDQIMIDEEFASNLEAQMQAELEEEERLARQKEEEDNIVLIESWDNTQAMLDADYELAARLQEEERGELTIEEKSRLFVELMDKRKKICKT
nr:putative ribonuclease H-like domain-containing protein [Tanacetum cinerariifolium]